MHLRSRNLPRPSASSPPHLRSHPMANPGQVLDLEGLHREIHDMAEQMRIMNENNGRLMQLLAAANPPLPAAPPVPDIERSRHSNRSGDRSRNISADRVERGRRQAPSSSLREKSSSESSKTPTRSRRGGSPHRGDHIRGRDRSTSQKIRDLDSRLDAINTETNALVTVDTLIRQTEPPFTGRVLRARVSSKFKLPTQLGIYEGKTDPMDHLDSCKSLMLLQDCSDEVMYKAFSATLKGPARSWFRKLSPGTAVLEVEDPSDKVVIMAMMEGLRPGPLFDSLFKNVPETLSALQSKADKYIAAEEEETRYKRPDRDPKRSSNRRPRTPPRRPEFILPPLNAPVAQKKGTATTDQLRAIYKQSTEVSDRAVIRLHPGKGTPEVPIDLVEEEVYNLSSSFVADQTPITFSNDDLRGVHLPHDDALVVSAVIANFNVLEDLDRQQELGGYILFISAFEKMKIGLDKLHPFPYPLIGFGGNTTHPLGWINLPITLGTEPHQTTIWQDLFVVDCPSPYNAILGRPTLGGIKAIISTYHLKLKFPTPNKDRRD
ncbi:hypothetical protein Acr_23g0020560 [Actinidia rufa]|uniref:Retrotransposon gag domain-containing protein n=1 Tax=Actinidia rufa TaxID=165716 RepID=A0A7J0GSC5_9ERIC|nr:hypothetical protein Acr_23g0020560 [Actinidia rufa]